MPTDAFGRDLEPERDRPAFAPPVAPEPRVANASSAPAAPAAPDHRPGAPEEPRAPAGPDGAPGAGERPWPWWSALAALFTGWLGGQVLASIVIVAADSGTTTDDDLPIGLQIVAQLIFSACLVGAVVFFARLGGRPTPARFGLRPTPVGRAVLWIVAGFVTFTIVGGAWLALTDAQDEQDLITETLTENPTTATVVGLAFLTVVIAPIVEEVVFRGFVFQALRSAMPVGVAAAVSGLLFGVVHVFGSPVEFIVPLAVLGTILALIFWRTGSLYPCIALHALNNCIAFGSARDWSWEIVVLLAVSAVGIASILFVVLRLGDRRAQPA